MRTLRHFGLLALAATIAATWPDAVRAAEDTEYSEAQILLFRTPHLDGVERQTTLDYDYHRETNGGEGFDDRVAMTVTGGELHGDKDLTVAYLTGSRQKTFEDFTDFRGNPLVMVFLEDDVRRMSEKFGGGGIYMRNRIRYAFFDQATAEAVTFELDGRTVDGTKVTVRPFVGDKYREKLGEYEHKVYEFVVSPAVPGGIYQMHSYVPSPSASGKPMIEDTLTYRGAGT